MFTKAKVQINFPMDECKEIQKYLKFKDISQYGEDFGGMIFKKPMAVFMPPTVEVLQQFLKIANKYKIKVTCRGAGNTPYGQSQVENDGVIIDLKNMDLPLKFNSSECSSISIPAFKTWFEVIQFSLEQNKTIQIPPDNLRLPVAGTLSFGLLGGESYRKGSGAKHVLSLDVITMNGDFHRCSENENPELFNAVLCGIGQFGIIINVNVPLIPAKKHVTLHFLSYDNPTQFLREQKILYDAEEFDHIKGFIRGKEKREYVLEVASYDDDKDQSAPAILKRLSPTQHITQKMSYWEFTNMVTNFIELLRDNGKLNVPHPWYNILVPEDEIENHLKKVLDTPYLTGTEPIIIYPMNRDHFKKQPLFMHPNGQTFYLLGVLYNTSLDAIKEYPYQKVLRHNYELYLNAKQRGAYRYPVDAIPFTRDDWKDHYGKKWDEVCWLKEKYDPNYLLSTGVNMFNPNLKMERRLMAKL